MQPAAFRRLCVETKMTAILRLKLPPAAFRRLCVETLDVLGAIEDAPPAAFRRLCVETPKPPARCTRRATSRLQAAVC